jgi:hypothetical protein
MPTRLPLLIALGALLAAPASAQVYKWVDERGVTNYSNSPPPATAAKREVVVDKTDYPPPAAAPERSIDQRLADRVAQLERELAVERDARYRDQAQPVPSYAPYPDYPYPYPYPVAVGYAPLVRYGLPVGAIVGRPAAFRTSVSGHSLSARGRSGRSR